MLFVLIHLITTSICVYNNRLHLHICIFACMQIVPRELHPPRNLYVVIRAGENDDAKGLIASTKLAFYHIRTILANSDNIVQLIQASSVREGILISRSASTNYHKGKSQKKKKI